MSIPPTSDQVPSNDELESLFVNNIILDRIEGHLNRFNPIKTMKMERMEIRHSAILAWLLDSNETHGFGDRFLKAFLAEAMRGHVSHGNPTALEISQSDLRDAEIRREWLNIDILILSRGNSWAFIVENKFDSKQRKDQLSGYVSKVRKIYQTKKELKIQGVFLTLWDEEPEDQHYAPINYQIICSILERLIDQKSQFLSAEVDTFIRHYLDIIKEATGMNEETQKLEILARQLYLKHKRVLDFIIEHGASTDFATAARMLFGDNPERGAVVKIEKSEYVFGTLSSNRVSLLPKLWYKAFGNGQYGWSGCENWWIGFPLIIWLTLTNDSDGTGGQLRLHAEVGPISDYEFRKSLISKIQEISTSKDLRRVRFQNGAANLGKRYSKFLKDNSLKIDDTNDPDGISKAMTRLLEKFEQDFEAIAEILPQFLRYGSPKRE